MSVELWTTTSLHSISTSALLDSGATGMFVNRAFAQKHKLETRPLPNPVPVHNVDGTPNENRSITEEVEVILQYSQHMEKHTSQSPTSDGRPSSSDIRGLPITTWKLTGLTSRS